MCKPCQQRCFHIGGGTIRIHRFRSFRAVASSSINHWLSSAQGRTKPHRRLSFHAGDVRHPRSPLLVLADSHFQPWGYENLVNDVAFTSEVAPFEFTAFGPFEWLPNPLLVVIGPRRGNASLQTVLSHSCPLLSFLVNVKNGCSMWNHRSVTSVHVRCFESSPIVASSSTSSMRHFLATAFPHLPTLRHCHRSTGG